MFKTGDHIRIKCDGRDIEGQVRLASHNGVSLMLAFEAILFGHIGMMPVLKTDDGYVTLFGDPVGLEKL